MTCCEFTPGGATELAEILGKQETIARIDTAVGKLQTPFPNSSLPFSFKM